MKITVKNDLSTPKIIVYILMWLALSFSGCVMAQNNDQGWGVHSKYGRMYNPVTVHVITGKVTRVEEFKPMRGMSVGIHLTVQTDSSTVSVHLGPAWYINKQTMKIKEGDQLEVTGSLIMFDGTLTMIAAEIKKGKQTMKLRDAQGIPYWSRGYSSVQGY